MMRLTVTPTLDPQNERRPRLILLDGGAQNGESMNAGEEIGALKRLVRGDLDALGVLYDMHHQAVRTFARRLLGDISTAEDLVQDTFLTFCDAASKVKEGGSVRNYLIGIAANLSRHHVRSLARRRKTIERMELEPVVNSVSSPEQEFDREQLAQQLQWAMDQLPHEHRVTFVLSELEERSGPEIASILGIPEATVRTRLFHAKKKLREILEVL